ncbi:MAG: O-antigen ligase family protein [Myxococcaceae bacterium]|nr:O-antigen ligase family protein [Myxococcaceae bacterium]
MRDAAAIAAPAVASPPLGIGRVWVFLCGVSIAGSGFSAGRLAIGGFLVHPIVVAAAVAFPVLLAQRARQIPPRLAAAMVCFAAAYGLAMFTNGEFYHPPVVKIVSTLMIILTTSLLVQSEADRTAGTVGLMLGVSILALHGLFIGGLGNETFSVLKDASGNKNAFSLYALPTMLVGGALVLRRGTSLPVRLVVGGGWVLLALTIFLSANRSGWAGVVVVGLALFVGSGRRRLGTVTGLAVGGGLTYLVMTTWFDTGVFERRWAQTVEGYASDDLREELFVECFKLGLENPVLGVGQRLDYELAKRVSDHSFELIGPHNALTALFGLGGLVLVTAWLALGRQLWVIGKGLKETGQRFSLMHLLVALWLFRAAFADETMYSPTFAMCFGLLIGAARLKATPVVRRARVVVAPPRQAVLSPS